MVAAIRQHWIAAACVLFVVLNALLTARDFPWLAVMPAVLLAVWAMVVVPERVLYFIAFATPLSINLEDLELGGVGVSLPTEPLMLGLTFLMLLRIALQRGVLSDGFVRHPITWVVISQLVWMAVCIIPSSMPVVSIKYMVARLWFVGSMFLLASLLFRDTQAMHRFIKSFVAGLVVVVLYTLYQHSLHHFAHDPAHWVMSPFFKDHTSYGAVLAFVLPFMVAAVAMPGYSRTEKAVAFVLLTVLVVGLVFSYTRAAWLSLVGALGLFVVMRFKVPAWVLGLLIVIAGIGYYVNKDQITIALERNRKESSDDLKEHVQSISNISSDASNLERLNRWNSAGRMWQERPLFGWGPGTYMFQYAPFQASEDRTIISTNFGSGGNAHSEYLGPLAEQGFIGMGLMLALVLLTAVRAIGLYHRMPDGVDKRVMTAAFLGLVTYYLHGALNNFLDLDKASVPFWAFTTMIVLFDLKYPKASMEEVTA
ncbi:MAG: O-antigen ligase family protein [Flavobacteriales bacterium]|nr:O-antigen ligase family protein [Flavobacteriales bacterium]